MADEDELSHEYDAAERRAYYLRTRKLKGRNPESPEQKVGRTTGSMLMTLAQARKKRREENRRKQEAQVEALKAKLEKLREVLTELVKQAKLRSGVSPKKDNPDTKDRATKPPKLTPAQKKEAAEKAKEYREKNPEKALAEDIKSLNDKIKAIQERITKLRNAVSAGTKQSTLKRRGGNSQNGS